MPKIPLLSPYQSHVVKWSACRLCELCDQRSVAMAYEGVPYPSAFCNLVGCFPKIAKREGTNEPSENAIKKCRDRLIEILMMAQPLVVVCVGKLSTKWLRKHTERRDPAVMNSITIVDITHPAAILRQTDSVVRDHQVQTAVVRIRTALEDANLVPF